MKIAVASQNFRTITTHAGRARRFIVFDAADQGEPQEVDRLDLPKEMSMHEFHADGPHPLDDVDVLIAGSMGPGFARRMTARGIVAVTTDLTDPVEAVKAYLARRYAGVEEPAPATCSGGHAHTHTHAHSHRHRPHRHRHGHGAPEARMAEGDGPEESARPSGETSGDTSHA
ncbi:MAG: nitrogen fixation protein [Rhodospirillales bacterium]|nr:MAG: nitrogen fixation protein [Rhodospirillales bacterium]